MNWTTTQPRRPDGRSSRWDQHRMDRRRDLARAARQAVHEVGPQASMDEIAAHAGTSKSVFYRYFGDRAGLQRAVATRVTSHLERRLLETAESSTDGAAALRRMVEVCLALAASSPHVYAFAVAGADGQSGQDSTVLTPFFERISGILEDGLSRSLAEQGRSLDPRSPLALWPRASVGMVRAAVETWLAQPETTRPSATETAEGIAGWLLDGVLAAVTPRPAPDGTDAPEAPVPQD